MGMTSLEKVCEQYLGEGDDADCICEDKLNSFLKSIGINHENEKKIVWGLYWKLECTDFGEISQDQFLNGFKKMGVTNGEGIKSMVLKLRTELKDNRKAKFEKFYMWLFTFFIALEYGRKTLPPNQAIEIWKNVLVDWPLCEKYVSYSENNRELKAVSKDLWKHTWLFIRDVKPNLSNWSECDDGSWPSHIDGFIEYLEK